MLKKILIATTILLVVLSTGCFSEGTDENNTVPTLPATVTPTPTHVRTCLFGSPVGCNDGDYKVVYKPEMISTHGGDTCLIDIGNVTYPEERVVGCWMV